MPDRIGVMLIHSCGCLGYYTIIKPKDHSTARDLYDKLMSVPCESCEEKGGENDGEQARVQDPEDLGSVRRPAL